MSRVRINGLTPRQFGDVIGVAKHKILADIHAGELRAVRQGNRFRIQPPAAVAYLRKGGHDVPVWLSDAEVKFNSCSTWN